MKASSEGTPFRGGFTLIEVLVSVAILAMIFSIVFGTFFYTVTNAEEQEERAAVYHRAVFILNNISQNVSSAFVPFGGEYSDEDSERPAFIGTDTPVGDTGADSLSVFTTNPRFAGRAMAGEIAYVSYTAAGAEELEEDYPPSDENNPLVLQCRVEPLFSASGEEEGAVEWSLDIRSLNIEYSDGTDWVSEWAYDDQGALPQAVKVELELADTGGNVYSFSTIARVQVNTVLEEPGGKPREASEQLEDAEETKKRDEEKSGGSGRNEGAGNGQTHNPAGS